VDPSKAPEVLLAVPAVSVLPVSVSGAEEPPVAAEDVPAPEPDDVSPVGAPVADASEVLLVAPVLLSVSETDAGEVSDATPEVSLPEVSVPEPDEAGPVGTPVEDPSEATKVLLSLPGPAVLEAPLIPLVSEGESEEVPDPAPEVSTPED
jgi:hypothetical protein